MSEYNGYKNFETFIVTAWIDNDQALHDHWIEQARTLSRYDLKEALKTDLEEQAALFIPEHGALTDLLYGAIREVDFYQIADRLINNVEELD